MRYSFMNFNDTWYVYDAAEHRVLESSYDTLTAMDALLKKVIKEDEMINRERRMKELDLERNQLLG